jgi:hypothetical protein
LTFEGSVDGTNYFAVNAIRLTNNFLGSTVTGGTASLFQVVTPGFTHLRLRVSTAGASATDTIVFVNSAGAGPVSVTYPVQLAASSATTNIGQVSTIIGTAADGVANSSSGSQSAAQVFGYNGTTWDRLRLSTVGTSIAGGSVGVLGVQGVSGGVAMGVNGTGTAGTPNAGVVTIQGITGGTAVPISGTVSATTTFPYSGTSDGQTATTASVVGLGAFNGTTYDRIRSSAPGTSVTTAGVLPIQGVTGGVALPVSGSVSVSNFPATQPVSGTVTANAGTGTFTVGGTVTANAGTGFPSATAAGTSGTSLTTIQGSPSGVAVPVSISGTVPVSIDPGAFSKTILTSASATACTSLETATAGVSALISITNQSATGQTQTISFYDEGASPSCANADGLYTIQLGASQSVLLNFPLSSGLAYKLTGALTAGANIIVVRK